MKEIVHRGMSIEQNRDMLKITVKEQICYDLCIDIDRNFRKIC